MKYETDTGTHAAADKPHMISIRLRTGIWSVALNGAFYGDFVRKNWAIEAAFEKADEITARGGDAVITLKIDGQQDALCNTRSPTPGRLELAQPTRGGLPVGVQRLLSRIGDVFSKRRVVQAKT